MLKTSAPMFFTVLPGTVLCALFSNLLNLYRQDVFCKWHHLGKEGFILSRLTSVGFGFTIQPIIIHLVLAIQYRNPTHL
jgi:hypothetical protein